MAQWCNLIIAEFAAVNLEVVMESQIIIKNIGQELRTDSRLLEQFLDHRHRTILEAIDKYIEQFQELNPVPFQTEQGKPLPHGGFAQPIRYALLNESQCYFLLTLMRNNERVVQAKLQLVKAFEDARKQLAIRDHARIEGKAVRRSETDAIQSLVAYASANGSGSAERYYVAITKMTNSFLGIESGQRKDLDASTLKKVATVESVVDIAIRDGIKAGLPYKAIYAMAKERVLSLAPALGFSGNK
jgi:phage regulator Rha-like protein